MGLEVRKVDGEERLVELGSVRYEEIGAKGKDESGWVRAFGGVGLG